MSAHGTDRTAGTGLVATILDCFAALRSVLCEEIAMRIPAAIGADPTIFPAKRRR